MGPPGKREIVLCSNSNQEQTDGIVALVYSSHDTEHNNAVVLKQELERMVRHIGTRTARHPPSA